MKWAGAYFTPGQIVLLRVVFGLVPVLVYALATKALSWTHVRHTHHFLVMSLLVAALSDHTVTITEASGGSPFFHDTRHIPCVPRV